MNCHLLTTCIALAMCHLSIFVHAQDLYINEIMSSNETYLADKDGDFSDWLEIYNASNQSINLAGYQLSDEEDDLNKWLFPAIVLPANGFLLVFASGKDSHNANELHTNFKIQEEGETIILSRPNDDILSKVEVPSLPSDYSYGCVPDGNATYSIFKLPSHNATNAQSNAIYTSHSSGFYLNPFSLVVKSSDPNQQIYFTTNGNIPTTSDYRIDRDTLEMINNLCLYSLWHDNFYSRIPTTPLDGPGRLQAYIWKEPQTLYKANAIRYASFLGDTMKSQVYTKTYFIDPEVRSRYQFPIISIITDSSNLFDYEKGIYIPGKRFDEEGFGHHPYGNYMNSGIEWEKEAHISFLENDGTVGFETDAGIRVRGVGSTANPQKSLNVYFRKEYGHKDIDYPIFGENINTIFKRMVLRNSGNDFINTHFRDALLQDVLRPLDLELQRFRPSVVFINGEYWGIHNIREKYDKFYFEYNFGIDVTNLNIVDWRGNIEEGSNQDYLALLDYIATEDISQEVHYEYIKEKVDIENFMDYLIAEIYYANFDWPCNNYKIWKTNEASSKWRFLIYDLDYSFGLVQQAQFDVPSLEHASSDADSWPHCPTSNALFRALLKNETFKMEFIQRFSLHLNTTFHIDTVLKKIREFEELFFPEMQEHMERWNYPKSLKKWYCEINIMEYFAIHRPCYMKSHLMSFFDLETIDFECPSFEEYDDEDLFQVFPNPNNGVFHIQKKPLLSTFGDIMISNVEGKIVYTKKDIVLDNYNRLAINLQDITGLSSGVYFVYFKNDTFSYMNKIVVIR